MAAGSERGHLAKPGVTRAHRRAPVLGRAAPPLLSRSVRADRNLICLRAVDVYRPEVKTGGTLMFMLGRMEISFVPTIDRRYIPAAPEFTDLAWYLHALCLPSAGRTRRV